MQDSHLPEATQQAIHHAVRAAVREALVASAPRVGVGYDIHRFVDGRPLVLGGVKIPSDRGLQGHSDADAVTHAIIDALLGAAALGDIGQHFPDTDPAWAGADSLRLLLLTRDLVENEGYFVSSVDVTIIAERPRLLPHIAAMRQALAEPLRLSPLRISVKATTHEGMGALGRGEGIAALATAMLVTAGQLAFEESDFPAETGEDAENFEDAP